MLKYGVLLYYFCYVVPFDLIFNTCYDDLGRRKRRRGKSDSSCEIISSESDPDFKDNKKKYA